MRKIWLLLAMVAMAFAATGCGGDDEGDAGDADADTDADTDMDADTDTDADTDADTDTDSDTDTDTGSETGAGECLPQVELFDGDLTEALETALSTCAGTTCLGCALGGADYSECGGVVDTKHELYVDCDDKANEADCTFQLCIERCVEADEGDTESNATVNDANLADECFGCWSGAVACAAQNCAAQCLDGGTDCDTCRCDEGCVEGFESCSGLPSGTSCE